MIHLVCLIPNIPLIPEEEVPEERRLWKLSWWLGEEIKMLAFAMKQCDSQSNF